MLQGSQWLVWYFRALGGKIGKNVCLYPNGGDPMMTEPELVTIGDGASVDNASLIAHINTRGTFRLNPVKVGSYCVLKTMCRLLSGASMDDHSIMLEHTLVLAGETVDKGKVWQGWPSEKQFLLEDYRQDIKVAVNEARFDRLHTPFDLHTPLVSRQNSRADDDVSSSKNTSPVGFSIDDVIEDRAAAGPVSGPIPKPNPNTPLLGGLVGNGHREHYGTTYTPIPQHID
jgi:hypothetical protein